MIYPITPVPKPRQTQADKWKRRPAVMRYRAFADEVRAHAVVLPDANAHVFFRIPMPASWSQKKKRKMMAQPHTQVPDLDNLIKALCDALYGDDSVIWDIRATKTWALNGAIEII